MSKKSFDQLSCEGKVAHASRKEAVTAMNVQLARCDHMNGRDRPILTVLVCGHCGLFHVGTVTKDQVRKSPYKRERFRYEADGE